MALSSLSVVTNANRLRRFTPRPVAKVDPTALTVTPTVELANEYDEEDSEMHHDDDHDHAAHSQAAVDPVCKMEVDPANAAASREHDGKTYSFCSKGCAAAFDADPAQYATS